MSFINHEEHSELRTVGELNRPLSSGAIKPNKCTLAANIQNKSVIVCMWPNNNHKAVTDEDDLFVSSIIDLFI